MRMKWALAATLSGFMALPLSAQSDLPEGEGRDVVLRLCTACHGVDEFSSSRKTEALWSTTVDSMIDRGATGKDEEFDLVIKYLAKYLGSSAPATQKINVNKAAAKDISSTLDLLAEEAALIVQYREKNGAFKDISELKKVSGIDAKKIDAKKDRIEF